MCYIFVMSYSIDFRRKVLSVRKKEKLTISEVATRFNIGIATVVRWIKRLEKKSYKREAPSKIDLNLLAKDIEKYPDAYHSERAERFNVDASAICLALKRLGVSYKKNSAASEGKPRRTTYISKQNRRI